MEVKIKTAPHPEEGMCVIKKTKITSTGGKVEKKKESLHTVDKNLN